MPSKDEVIRIILPQIRAKSSSGLYISDIDGIDSFYPEVQDALLWLEGKGLITAFHLKERGEYINHINHATITFAGQDYMDNGYSFSPLKVQVVLDDEQLKEIILVLAKRFGKPDQSPALASFLEKAGNAGINALCSETVKYMLALLPEVAKRFLK